MIAETRGKGSFNDAWAGYRSLVLELARQVERPRLLEIGGGRRPLLTQAEVDELHCEYTVNDIDAGELALAPPWVERLHGDIADPALLDLAANGGAYDLVFSEMVFEHVEHPEQGYRNIARLLAPGGILVNFVPTLYAAPFVLNRLLPDALTARVLKLAHPNNNSPETPKFRAYYRWCTTTSATKKKLDSVGFRQTAIAPFYGHGYYAKIPVLRGLSGRVSSLAARHDWRSMSTYAYIIGEA